MKDKTKRVSPSKMASTVRLQAEIRGFLNADPQVIRILTKQADSADSYEKDRARWLLYSQGDSASAPSKEFADVLCREAGWHIANLHSAECSSEITHANLALRRRLLKFNGLPKSWKDCCTRSYGEELLWLWIIATVEMDREKDSPLSMKFWEQSDLNSATPAALAATALAAHSKLIEASVHSWEERVRLLNLMAKRSIQIESSTRFQSHPLWNAMATALGIFEVDRGAIVTVPEDCNEMAALGERDPMTACWILGRALRPFAVRKASTVQGVRMAWLNGLAQNVRTTTFGQDILRWRRDKNNPFLRWALKEAWFSKGDFHAHPDWIIEMDILRIPTQGNILELHEFEEIARNVPGELAQPDATLSDAEVFRTRLIARRILDAAKY